MPELRDFSPPIIGLCVSQQIDDALGVRRLAIQSDIALTCVPFLERNRPVLAATGSPPDVTFLLAATTAPETMKAVRDAVAILDTTTRIVGFPFEIRTAEPPEA